jgi:drug/metabolite transporter (DMT)-like permease
VIAVICALGAALSNALGTVLQRRAARRLPADDTMRLVLVKHLLRQPAWYAGIGGLIGGFLLQATALSNAGLALVQPVISVELPITLLLAARVFRRRVDRDALVGVLTFSGGLALLIVATAPHGGRHPHGTWPWILACGAGVAAVVALLLIGLALRAGARAALFGCATGLTFGTTAALMKGALDRVSHGWPAVLGSWQLYAMVVFGVIGVYLNQNTLQSGSLIAGQPAITACEPLSSILYGVLLFHESLRSGGWLIVAVLGGGVLAGGSVLLSRSPLATAGTEGEQAGANHSEAVRDQPGAGAR